jgi:hypothetical protein
MREAVWKNGGMGQTTLFRRFLTREAIPPWLLFLWAVAEVCERIEYIKGKADRVWEALVSPHGLAILIIISVLWLTAVGFWPAIRGWLKKIGWEIVPKPPLSDRVSDAETQLVKTRLDVVKHDIEIDGLGTSSKDSRARIVTLSSALKDFPQYVVRQNELTELIQIVRSCSDEYQDLRALYQDHPAATKPFASAWRRSRPEEQADGATKHFERWAAHMERYVRGYDAFSDKWIALRDRPEFWGWVTNWRVNRHDTDATKLTRTMMDHLGVLMNTRDGYAADLEKAIGNPSAAIS